LLTLRGQLGAYVEGDAPWREVVGARGVLVEAGLVLEVAGVGRLQYRRALAGVVTGVRDVGGDRSVAALGILLDLVLSRWGLIGLG